MSTWLKNKRLVIGVILISAAFGFYQARTGTSSDKGKPIGRVTRGELIQRVTIAGATEPHRKTFMTAPYNGYVKQLFVKIGDSVQKGSPLVSVVPNLQSQDLVYPLRAPFSGTIVYVNKSEGEYAKENDSTDFILRLDDLSRMYVFANVPELDLPKIQLGQEVVIRASAILDRSYKGVIKDISLASKALEKWGSAQVEFPVRIEITDPDAQLKSGMSVIVDIITKKITDVLLLGHEYIEQDGSQNFVTLKNGQKQKIEVGTQNEMVFEIRSGLKEGDQILPINFIEKARE